jgi:branched-chain amino acid transport system permease protein
LALLGASVILAFTGPSSIVFLLDTVLMTCLGAVALQLLQGTAGLVSVGTAAFLLCGSFGAVFLLRAGVPFPFDVFGAAIFSGLVGIIAAIPSLRMKGLYLALATLAFHYIAIFAGNEYQLHVPGAAATGFFVPVLYNSYGLSAAGKYWAITLAPILAIVLLGANRLATSRFGRALRIIRDHEHIAPVLGIPVKRYKVTVFAMSSMLVGFEGGLFVYFNGNVSTDNFTLLLAFQYVAMIVIGGLDSLVGAVVGATIVVALPTVVPDIIGQFGSASWATTYGPNVAEIIYGILVVVFVTASPDGLAGLWRRWVMRPVSIARYHRKEEI